MFYAAFPPEFNSGRMYTGPGSGSLRAAAAAWDGLAAELQSTVSAYSSTIDSLVGGPWAGPSSVAMLAAITPYLSWMQATAGTAGEAAAQATAAASAYEAAFAAHVPPTEIAANRSQLASLVATNLFGQNTPAIAATEAQYGEMWAQDALAMDSYATSSAAASKLTPFTAAPQTTNTAGTAMQAAAVTAAAATPAGSVGSAVTAAASATTATGPLGLLASLATAYTEGLNSLINAVLGPNGSAWYTALYNAIKVPLGFTTGYNDIGLLINFPASQFLKFAPHAATGGLIPRDALGGGLLTTLGPGHAIRCGDAGWGIGGFWTWHLGRKVAGSAELGHGHPGYQDGRGRVVGRRTGSSSGGRAWRGRTAQFDVPSGHARQRHRRRGSRAP